MQSLQALAKQGSQVPICNCMDYNRTCLLFLLWTTERFPSSTCLLLWWTTEPFPSSTCLLVLLWCNKSNINSRFATPTVIYWFFHHCDGVVTEKKSSELLPISLLCMLFATEPDTISVFCVCVREQGEHSSWIGNSFSLPSSIEQEHKWHRLSLGCIQWLSTADIARTPPAKSMLSFQMLVSLQTFRSYLQKIGRQKTKKSVNSLSIIVRFLCDLGGDEVRNCR